MGCGRKVEERWRKGGGKVEEKPKKSCVFMVTGN